MFIRHAVLDDLPAIAAVEAHCFPPAEAADEAVFRDRLTHYPQHFWLLFIGEELVSFVDGMATDEPDLRDAMYADASLHLPQGRWQMIFGVNTLPQYRRQGHAERVLRHAIAEAQAAGRAGLVLTCKDALVPFYGKLGFVDEGFSESSHGGVCWHQMRLTF
ncbi:GNAT family N-acetyltransferase [Mailhella sp.]|uniref:GNAT family N-acetyltransferase n=1 Tax=Mailhella sp. TaxID=1981029 RepID=UPI004062BBAB